MTEFPSNYPPRTFDSSKPHSARVWNYWLGGKDYFEVDREYGDQVIQIQPEIVNIARASRDFLRRAITYLVSEVGIRQFLDIGTGLPTADNTHEVAQRIVPESRVVYVDNDPLVLVHARALLVGTTEGATTYIDADVREPEKILAGAAETLDFSRPIALVMMGVLGAVPDTDKPHAILRQLVDALPSDSYLVASDGNRTSAESQHLSNSAGFGYQLRATDEIARYFDGLELVRPGAVSVSQWRPSTQGGQLPVAVGQFGGVARKP